MPPSLLEVIQKAAPQAQVAMGDGGELLMIVGTPAEHAKIAKTIDQITKKTFIEKRSQLAVYPVTPSQRTRFEAVVASLKVKLPGMEVIPETQPGELAIWAHQQQHELIKEILDELKLDLPAEEKAQLVGYPITSADPTERSDRAPGNLSRHEARARPEREPLAGLDQPRGARIDQGVAGADRGGRAGGCAAAVRGLSGARRRYSDDRWPGVPGAGADARTRGAAYA